MVSTKKTLGDRNLSIDIVLCWMVLDESNIKKVLGRKCRKVLTPLSTSSNLKALKDRIGRREKNIKKYIVSSEKKMQEGSYFPFLLHQT